MPRVYDRKQYARDITNMLIRHGAIKRKPCFFCGNPWTDCNHKDYKKPWKVSFLCSDCHTTWHIATGSREYWYCYQCFICRIMPRLKAWVKLYKKFLYHRVLRRPIFVAASNEQIWQTVAPLRKERTGSPRLP